MGIRFIFQKLCVWVPDTFPKHTKIITPDYFQPQKKLENIVMA